MLRFLSLRNLDRPVPGDEVPGSRRLRGAPAPEVWPGPHGRQSRGGSIGGEGRELSRLGAQAWEPTFNAGGGTGREGLEVSRRDKKRAVKSC